MRTLVVAASPADAEFACGGTLLRLAAGGASIAICTIANGNSTADGVPPREQAETRRAEAEAAAEVLGAELFWLDHSDFAVSNDAVTRLKLVEVMRTFRPGAVIVPAPVGPVQDVRNAWPLVGDAARMAGAPNARTDQPALDVAPRLIAYDPGWTSDFRPTEAVDVTDVMEAKIRALQTYATLLPWRQSHDGVDLVAAARAIGAYRGLQAGVAAAEVFRDDGLDRGLPTSRILP